MSLFTRRSGRLQRAPENFLTPEEIAAIGSGAKARA